MRSRRVLYRRPDCLAALVASTLLWSGVAGAQGSGDDIDEIVVEGRYLSLDKINSVKTPTPIVDVPQSLSILTAQQISDQAFQNFGDVLRYTPGLSISQGEGHRDAIIIRGIQTTADFFVDGVRDDVQYYRPLYNVQQVEILRGANALLFGRGGGGGVINRVQKSPVLGEGFSSANISADTFGAYNAIIDSNISTGEASALRVNGFYQRLDNHRDFYEGRTYAFNPTFKADLSPATSVVISYEYLNDDRVVDRGVPSRIVDGGPNVPIEGFEDTFFGSPDQNFTTFEAHLLRTRIDHTFSDTLRGNITAQFADYDKLYQNLYPSDSVVVTNGTIAAVELDGYLDTTDRQNLIVQANLIGEFETGPIGHTLLFGVETGRQETANARLDNLFADANDDQDTIAFTNPLVIPQFGFTEEVRNRDSDVSFTSLYLQNQIDLTDRVKLIAGLRYDAFDIDVVDRIEQNDGDNVDGNFSREDTEVTPRLGIIYKPADNISVYASYSETFLPRSGDQFLTLTLDTESTRPQFFRNREVGFKWDMRADLSLTAAVFELDRESFTTIDPEDPEQVILVEGSETSGVELQLTGNITDRWSLTTGIATLDGRVVRADGSGTDGNKTRQTPDRMFSVWSQYRFSEAFGAGLGATYQDSFFVREDNSVEVPAFTRVDAAAFYRVSERLRLQLNIENLLDETYFPDAHSNDNITTGEPLNARLTAMFDF